MQWMSRTAQAYNHQARIFFLVVIALGFAIDGVYTVLLNLYLLRLEYGTEFIGLVNAVGLLTFAVTSLPAGILGSRFSNTFMMKIGAGVILVGGGLLPFAESVPPHLQDGWLVIFYGLLLMGFSLFFVNGAPFLMNIVPSGQESQAFSIQTALLAVAGFIGSLIGGFVPEIFANLLGLSFEDAEPYRLTLLIVSVVLGFAFLLILVVHPSSNEEALAHEDTPDLLMPQIAEWTLPALTLILAMTVVRLFQVAGSATVTVYFNVYMDTHLGISTSVIGFISAIGRLTGMPTALIVPFLVKRWGSISVIVWSATLTSAFMLPLALIDNWVAAAIGFIGVAAMNSIRFTAFIVYILRLVPKRQQAVMSGSGEMAGGFSFSIMALGGGIILSLFSFQNLFLLGAAFTLIGTLIFWLHHRMYYSKRMIQPVLEA